MFDNNKSLFACENKKLCSWSPTFDKVYVFHFVTDPTTLHCTLGISTQSLVMSTQMETFGLLACSSNHLACNPRRTVNNL
jgi:hypothetical protein